MVLMTFVCRESFYYQLHLQENGRADRIEDDGNIQYEKI